LHGVGDGRPDGRADVDEQDLRHSQRLGHAEELAESGRDLGHHGAERVHDALLEVLAAEAPLLDALDH